MVQAVPEILRKICGDGVHTVVLLQRDGSLLASEGDPDRAKLVSAIVTNIWSSYEQVDRSREVPSSRLPTFPRKQAYDQTVCRSDVKRCRLPVPSVCWWIAMRVR